MWDRVICSREGQASTSCLCDHGCDGGYLVCCLGMLLIGDYEFSAAKAKAAKEAVDRRIAEESKRKRYEERMMRKAKREGLPSHHYLQQGKGLGMDGYEWMDG